MTALPPALDRFGAELETAVRRDLGARRRRRLLRGAAIPAAAAAVALGILAVLATGGSSAVGRAAAALERSDDTILHVDMHAEQRNPDGSVVTWRSESWNLDRSPYTSRVIQVGSDGIRAESLVRGDTEELYDQQRNTIYVATQQELAAASRPKITIVSEARLRKLAPPGTHLTGVTALYYIRKNAVRGKVFATKAGAERLLKEQAQAQKSEGHGNEEPFRAEILAVLRSGHARVTGRVEIDGREAIRIESADGTQVYYVDPKTYDPIEWTSRGHGGSVTLRFVVYEQLPVNAESMKLLDLVAQHPQARVEQGSAAYRAAEARLFPHG